MQLSLLSTDQIELIHEASLEILSRIGVTLPHEETLSRFSDCGASVCSRTHRVKIPPDLVHACLAKAGKSFTLYGRDSVHQARFGQGQRNYNSIAGEACWLEEDTLTRRYATLRDVQTACKVGEALPQLTIVGAMTDPHDVPHEIQDVFVVREMIRHTTKPITFWFNTRASARYVSEMLIATAGSEVRASGCGASASASIA